MSYYLEVKDGEVVSSSPIEYFGDLPAVAGIVDVTGLDPMPTVYFVGTHTGSGESQPGDIEHVAYPWTYVDGVFAAPTGYTPVVTVDELRVERDVLLRSSDFTQLSDSPYTTAQKTVWATYRQELRDLPSGYTPVASPTYPTKP